MAKLKREALGRAQVAFAGSPLNCFHHLLVTFFSYKGEPSKVGSIAEDKPEEESDLLAAFCKVVEKSPAVAMVPEHKSATQTLAVTSTVRGPGTEGIRPQATPAMTRAIIF